METKASAIIAKPADKSLSYINGMRESPSKLIAAPPGIGSNGKVPFRLPSEILASRRGKRKKIIPSNKKTTARNPAKAHYEENSSVNNSEGIVKKIGIVRVPDSSASISPMKVNDK